VRVEAAVAGLNQALVAILKPSKEASDLAEALGIDFNEAGLRAKGFGGLLQEVKEKTGGSTTALVQLFGSVDALKAVLPLVNDDLVKYNQNVQKQADVSGVADKATEELGGTVSAEVSKMINQIGNLTRSLDTVLGPALGGIVKLINVVIAEATRGINVLGQLFSLGKNTTILKGALESGNLRGSAAARVIPGVDELIGQQRRQQLQRQAGAGTGFLGAGFNAQKFAELLKQQPEIKRLLAAGAAPAAGATAPAGVDPAIQAVLDGLAKGSPTGAGRSGGGGIDKAAREAEKLAQEAQREAELTARQLKAAQDRLFAAQQLVAKQQELNRVGEIELERNQIIAKIQREYSELISKVKSVEEETALEKARGLEIDAATLDANKAIKELRESALSGIQEENALLEAKLAGKEKEYLLQKQINDLVKAGGGIVSQGQAAALVQANDQLKQQVEAQDKAKASAEALAGSISSALTNSLRGLVDGSMTAQEALSDAFKGIGDAFIDMAMQMIQQWLTMQIIGLVGGFFGGAAGPSSLVQGVDVPVSQMPAGMAFRAMGGPVSSNQPYIVGERGPELFVPGVSGSVVSNADTRAALAQQATNRQGNDTRAMLEQQATNRQMNAGGNAMQQKPIEVKYESTVINGVEYVTAEQHQRGITLAAERGRALTLQTLQNSVKTRKRVGMA
jgi:hypothetical protein